MILLVIAIALGTISRLLFLDRFPVGISGDELDYILNAKAVFLTGKDISGTWSPFSLTTPAHEFPKGELPYVLLAPFIGPAPFSLFSARLPFVIIGVLFIPLLFAIVRKLLDVPQAIVVAFLMAINPLSIYFSRTSFEVHLTLFFYFLALYLIITRKGWHILWSFIPLFIAFYSYIGTKVMFLPFVIIAVFFSWYRIHQKQYLRQHSILVILCLLTFGVYLYNQFKNPSARMREIANLNNATIIQSVDIGRRLSIQSPLNNVALNKVTEFLKDRSGVFLNSFSTSLLFHGGEYTAFIALKEQGFLYYFDAIFILVGLCFLFAYHKDIWIFFLSLLAIAPIPSVVSNVGTSYAIRSSLAYIILLIISSIGIWHTIDISKKMRVVTIGAMSCLYIVAFLNYLHNYFFRFPIYGSETFNLSTRVLAKYVDIAKKNGKDILFIDKANSLYSYSPFKQYLFYYNLYNKQTTKELSDVVNNQSQSYRSLHLYPCRTENKPPASLMQNAVLITSDPSCVDQPTDREHVTIAQLKDGGEVYAIYENNLCTKYNLNRYPQNFLLRNFRIESMTEQEFCINFITKLN